MSFDENSPAFRRQSIFLFFKMKHQIHRAVAQLKSVFEDITFQEVDAWFARFKTGSRDIVTDVVIDNDARGMESMPETLKRKIMESVDVDDQKSLLKTNKSFRNILTADRRIYEEVKMTLERDCVALSLKNEITGTELIRYSKRDDGCEKRQKDGKVTLLSGSFINEGIERFKKAIEKKGTKIRRMEITTKSVTNEARELFNQKVGQVMKRLKEPLHVEELKILLCKKEDLYTVLEGMEVGALTDLDIKASSAPLKYTSDDCRSFERHFVHLKEVSTDNVDLESLEVFAGVAFVLANVGGITPDAVKKYRDKVLESAEFQHAFYGDYNREEIRAALEPFEAASEFDEFDGLITVPGKKPFSFKLERNTIFFQRENKYW